MKNKPFQKFSRLAFRSALISGIFTGLFTGLLAKFYFVATINSASIFGGIVALLTIVVVYLLLYTAQFPRLKKLNQIIGNINRKKFRDYEDLKSGGHDELNYLIKQSIRASKTVEHEIQRLNRIENYRKEFIGDISHELKTPIFSIQGFIETLLNGAIDDEGVNRKFLKKAQRNVNRLIFLTNDLMDISKLETGELKSEIEEMHLQNVIMDVVDNLQHKANKDKISLKTDIPEDIQVRADRNQIKQVLNNLVENAIKYNVKGGKVTVGTKPWSKDENRVMVYVKDTGIGVSEQYINRLTERFFRVDKSRSREEGGTGLGLAIVKHIMEAHNENLIIKSTPKVGSTFSFTLPKVKSKDISSEQAQ